MTNKIKIVNSEAKDDRISALPDHIIHHILSFLPSTRQAIQTGILSKGWRNQWTQVPVLIFDHRHTGLSYSKFLKFIDNTLIRHKCSEIKKFHLDYPPPSYCGNENMDTQFIEKIIFATRKNVEELYLSLNLENYFMLPKCVFNNASLVKLTTDFCIFIPNGKVNWGCLTELKMSCCKLPNKAIEHILSGCPLLKSLDLSSCYELHYKLLIVSKSLKRLRIWDRILNHGVSVIEISCPRLEQLSLNNMTTIDPKLFAQAIENVVSHSSFLESIELFHCSVPDQLVIASKSMKRLVLRGLRNSFNIEISCPKLETLMFLGRLNVRSAKLLNLPSSLCANIDFDNENMILTNEIYKSMIEDILQQLQHVKELTIGSKLSRFRQI